jgi:CRISPR-associated protein Cas5t
MDPISLMLSVPVCSFRKPYAREFFETERIPPPATVYGFLLSLVGEEDRHTYIGTKLAIALTEEPSVSTIIRTTWRIKAELPPGIGSNKKPDYQEILTGLEMLVCVADGELLQRIDRVATSAEKINRYGGVSLGESHDLVNDIIFHPELNGKQGHWLLPDKLGQFPLPIWVDHVGSKHTVWRQFKLERDCLDMPAGDDKKWITIVNEMRE